MPCYREVTWRSNCCEICRSTGMESPRHWRDHLRDKAIHSVEHRKKKNKLPLLQAGNSNYTNITGLTFLWAFTAGWLFICDAFHISSVLDDFSLTLIPASLCLWLKRRKGIIQNIRIFFASIQVILLKQQLPVARQTSHPLHSDGCDDSCWSNRKHRYVLAASSSGIWTLSHRTSREV